MSDFSTAMTALTGTITARVMTTLGLGFISYESLNLLASNLQTSLFNVYSLVDPDLLAVMNLCGLDEYLHIIVAAFITKAGMMAVRHIGVIPT